MCKAPMAPPVETKKPPRRAQHILRYASCKDVAMYAAAFVTVMVSGLNQPAQLIIFGNLLDSFNTADTAEAVRLVHFFALMYAVVGIQQLITITLQTALATRVAAAARPPPRASTPSSRRGHGDNVVSMAWNPRHRADETTGTTSRR